MRKKSYLTHFAILTQRLVDTQLLGGQPRATTGNIFLIFSVAICYCNSISTATSLLQKAKKKPLDTKLLGIKTAALI